MTARLTLELSSDCTRQMICDDLQGDLDIIEGELKDMDLATATARDITEKLKRVEFNHLSGQLPDIGSIGEHIAEEVEKHLDSKEYKEGDTRVFVDF